MLQRFPDWHKRLDEVTRQTYDEYPDGVKCGFFCADCINAMMGIDLAAEWRSKPMAAIALQDEYLDHVAGIMEEMGFDNVEPVFAQRGDLVGFMNEDDLFAVGIVDLTGRSFMLPDRNGMVRRLPLRMATHAWRIG
jgi:hypothetical protein